MEEELAQTSHLSIIRWVIKYALQSREISDAALDAEHQHRASHDGGTSSLGFQSSTQGQPLYLLQHGRLCDPK